MGAFTPRQGAVLVLLLSLTLSMASWAAAQNQYNKTVLGPPVELGCSVFVSGDWDYVQDMNSAVWASSCTSMVERARQRCGGSRINFVPTHYWADPGTGRGDPTATYQPTNYCYKFSTLFNVQGECREPTAEEINAYQGNMTMCFKKAVELGFDIEVTPHLDDGLGRGGWRNALDFDPAVKYGVWSYNDIMLTPLIKALGAAALAKTTVFFAMTGEMSLTVVKYPRSYATLAQTFKNPSFKGPQNLQVGVSMNFNKLYTVVLTPELVESENIPAADFREMCDVLDFIGISSYSTWATGYMFGRKELEGATRSFMKEVQHLGVDLEELVNVKGKGFHLSEYGVGGGTCTGGLCKAVTAEEVAQTPFYGIYGTYQVGNDPWQTPETSDFRLHFYGRTLWWLKMGGGPTIRVDAAYVWTLSSWDFAGINPQSTSFQGSYYNETVCKLIREYNNWVVVQRTGKPLPQFTPTTTTPTTINTTTSTTDVTTPTTNATTPTTSVATPTTNATTPTTSVTTPTSNATTPSTNATTPLPSSMPPPAPPAPLVPHFLTTLPAGAQSSASPAKDGGEGVPGEIVLMPGGVPAAQPNASAPLPSVIGGSQQAASASSQAWYSGNNSDSSNSTLASSGGKAGDHGKRSKIFGLDRMLVIVMAAVAGFMAIVIISSIVYVCWKSQQRTSPSEKNPEAPSTPTRPTPPQPDSPLEMYANPTPSIKDASPARSYASCRELLSSKATFSTPCKQLPVSKPLSNCLTPSSQSPNPKAGFSVTSSQPPCSQLGNCLAPFPQQRDYSPAAKHLLASQSLDPTPPSP